MMALNEKVLKTPPSVRFTDRMKMSSGSEYGQYGTAIQPLSPTSALDDDQELVRSRFASVFSSRNAAKQTQGRNRLDSAYATSILRGYDEDEGEEQKAHGAATAAVRSETPTGARRAESRVAPLTPQTHREQVRNVSESAPREIYDSHVPYILGLSNGEEIPDPISLPVQGRLPDWLQGALYLNGPAVFDIEYLRRGKIHIYSVKHWWDTLPLVHRFEIHGQDDAVEYRSRFTAKKSEQMIRHHAMRGNLLYKLDPDSLIPLTKKFGVKGQVDPSSAAMNFAIHPNFPLGRLYGNGMIATQANSSWLQELDPVTLIPKRLFKYSDLNDDFDGLGSSSQVFRDDVTGETIHATVSLGAKSTYKFFSILEHEQFEPPGHLICKITARPSPLFCFAVTKNYIVLIDFPFRKRLGKQNLAFGVYVFLIDAVFNASETWAAINVQMNSKSNLRFDIRKNTNFYVIDREKRTEVCRFKGPAFFALNVLNAFEDEDESVCIDLNAYDDDSILKFFDLKCLRTMRMSPLPEGTIRRVTLSRIPEAAKLYAQAKPARKVTHQCPEALYTHRSDSTLEFACINNAFCMRPARFCYGLGLLTVNRGLENSMWDCLVKADLISKSRLEWKEPFCYPSRPVFVPNPRIDLNYESEDNGVVLSVVLDSKNRHSFLLVLDAKDLSELARVPLPTSVPFQLHGAWDPLLNKQSSLAS